MVLSWCLPLVVVATVPGVPVSSVFSLVADGDTVPLQRFEKSLQRGVGPAATTATVGRFSGAGRVACRFASLWAFERATLRRVGDEVPTSGNASALDFELFAGEKYALRLEGDRTEWIMLWVDRSEKKVTRDSLPAGEHLSAPFVLSSTLTLDAGAVLRWRGGADATAFVTCSPSCSVNGKGAIDANGIAGNAILVLGEATLRDVLVFGSASWAIRVRANDVRIYGLKVFSGADGIDVDGASHVLVDDVVVNSWDDALVVKTTSASDPATSVRFANAMVWTRKSAFKVGTESLADFRDVTFADIEGYDLDRGCVVILRDGATARDLSFRNATLFFKAWHDAYQRYATGLEIEVEHRGNSTANSSVADVRFSDIRIQGPLLYAAAFKSVEADPLKSVLLSAVDVDLNAASSSSSGALRHQNATYLVACINTYVDPSVGALDLRVKWNGHEDDWPLGVSPTWPHHLPPPRAFFLPLCDLCCQRLEGGEFDGRRTTQFVFVAITVMGPANHGFELVMERVFPGTALRQVGAKVVSRVCCAPVFLSLNFASLAMVRDGDPVTAVTTNVVPAWLTGTMFWPAASAFTYRVVPVAGRAAFGSVLGAFWSTYLSFVAHRRPLPL
ncbi:hypothetical protein CTAYLR_001538 [Chrysophaeum taylorii]|uniref:Uncharacterized protein n=1 Tax=Chrysophaeum taylorii TaxID=2483200 RepID=A0AAD7UD72_9STRA|nr:hypothetical protein CTAYLR_001538 [Chrysophaeum taylorii]